MDCGAVQALERMGGWHGLCKCGGKIQGPTEQTMAISSDATLEDNSLLECREDILSTDIISQLSKVIDVSCWRGDILGTTSSSILSCHPSKLRHFSLLQDKPGTSGFQLGVTILFGVMHLTPRSNTVELNMCYLDVFKIDESTFLASRPPRSLLLREQHNKALAGPTHYPFCLTGLQALLVLVT
ncbi:unnamed protein product [Timema podura]|uniref:Uncharacterized protein n=1 Tax=Timema podura TaxID=61482 RepID=A0ABN7NBU2_TIMPD|nr:unnamed protein product [Timema podura]